MTINIIHLIVVQAKKDNMPEGLKFNTNTYEYKWTYFKRI